MALVRRRSTLDCLLLALLLASVSGCRSEPAPSPIAAAAATATATTATAVTSTPTQTATPTVPPTITPWPTRTPQPTWTPTPSPLAGDRERILYASDAGGGGYFHLFAVDPDGQQRAVLTDESVDEGLPRWSPTAEQLLFHSDREGNAEVYALAPGDYFPRNLTANPADDWDPAWSPDGRRIAFSSNRNDDDNEIYVMDADGGNVVRLTTAPGEDVQATWSPDGRHIAFVSERDGSRDIWVMDADGGDQTNVTRSEADCDEPAWSSGAGGAADGTIAFSGQMEDNWDVYLLDVEQALEGGEVDLTRLTDDPDTDARPAWSPDGTQIAFETGRTGNWEIFVLDVDDPGGTQVNVSRHAADDRAPQWVQTPSLLGLRVEDTAVLNLAGGNPNFLDPALAYDSTSHAYINEIFGGLVQLDEDLAVVPDIATRWEISDDGTVYTFFLRDDVKFQDGRPVTAQDFKYSIDRACDPELDSPTAASYLGDIVGAKEVLAGEADEVSGVQVMDDYTLKIAIDAPKSYFLAKLTYPTAFVVDEQAVEEWGAEWERHPNGTGPFRLALWLEDERIVLVRNDLYYDQMPGVKRVNFEMTGINMLMYEEGDLDMVVLSINDIERFQDQENPEHGELVEVPRLTTTYFGFNTAVPPFDDPKVRQAFARAFDRQKLIEVAYENTVGEAVGVLPPGMPAYDPEFEGIAYDPERARELLAESSYGGAAGLPEITLLISGRGGGMSPDVEAFISQMEDNLDVKIQVEQLESEQFWSALRGEHQHQLFIGGWVADYVDPENFLDLLFHSDSESNHHRYANSDLDALLEEARIERASDHRWEMYRQAEQMVIDDAIWIPIYHDINYYLVKPYVHGLVFTGQGVLGLEPVWLEERP